jgi:cytochrome c peroxidase
MIPKGIISDIEGKLVTKKSTKVLIQIAVLSLTFLQTTLYGASRQQLESLGQELFFDSNLSFNGAQSCATCHNPGHGFVDNRDNGVDGVASLGADGTSLGDRNTPSLSYIHFTPIFGWDEKKQQYKGGMFWDGREPDLKSQVSGPLLNPIEMGMADKNAVMARVKANPDYVAKFKQYFGKDIFEDDKEGFAKLKMALSSFEESAIFSPFDSKYDRFLRGEYVLSSQQELGKALFFSGNLSCMNCHVLHGEDQKGETFTNYEFHNIGVPVNAFLRQKNRRSEGQLDFGLGQNPQVKDQEHKGKFKVPSLRNVAVTGPYMHNGLFKNLETVILFYDKYNNHEQTINPETGKPWGEPEVPDTIGLHKLKMKRLNDTKIKALVAFLETLTDQRYEHLLEEKKNKGAK